MKQLLKFDYLYRIQRMTTSKWMTVYAQDMHDKIIIMREERNEQKRL